MGKRLVAFFSVSGVTKKVSESMAKAIGADLFEIVPEVAYTREDLDWTNKASRSTVEMQDRKCRPAVSSKVCDMSQYDTVFLGFPIWWGREPSVVDTFLDQTELSGKTIIPFCTSGGSDISGATANISEICGEKVKVEAGARLAGDISEADLKVWEEGLL